MYRHALSQARRLLIPPATALPLPSTAPYSTHRNNNNHRRREKHHYLIPAAYRRREPDNASDHRRERRHTTPRSIRSRPKKRRLKLVNLHMRRVKNTHDMETLHKMEEDLGVKLNEYSKRLAGDFAVTAAQINERERMERDFPTYASSSSEDRDVVVPAMNVLELYATEQMYVEITSEMKLFILGLCDVADSMCNNLKRGRNNSIAEEVPTSNEERMVLMKEYQNLVGKAENYLEAYETFCRDRVDAVERGRALVANWKEKDKGKVLEEVGSFLKGVFSNPLSRTTATGISEFDEAWKGADGSKPADSVTDLSQITPENYDALIRSHKNKESLPDVALYEAVLSANTVAYAFGRQAKMDATERSNRLLTRWILLYCSQKSETRSDIDDTATTQQIDESSKEDQEDADCEARYPEQRLFHLVMRQNADLWTQDGALRTEEWLRRMQSLQRDGYVRCAPDIHAYNLVLLSYCNLCKNTNVNTKPQNLRPRPGGGSFEDLRENVISRHTRNFVLNGAQDILTELHNVNDIDVDVLSLNLALNAIAKAGQHESKTCQRTDDLLRLVLGEESFDALIEGTEIPDVNSESDKLEPNLDTYHWIINIYSGGNLEYIKKTLSLLNKMIKMRVEVGDDEDGNIAPSTGTFNNALRALQCKVDEMGRLSAMSEDMISSLSPSKQRELQCFSPIDIAKEVPPMIDAMVQFESSLPTRVTFLFMLQIWSRTKAPEAGDQAEELLSRMETISSYHPLTPFSNAYRLALQCWLTSATAGRPGAVERANRLLEIMEAQHGHHDRKGKSPDITPNLPKIAIDSASENTEDKIHDNTFHDYSKLYLIMLKICAASEGKQDTARAVDIAFYTLDKMIDRGLKPRGKAFELIYCTVDKFIQSHPQLQESDKKKIRDKVFARAEENKVTRGELIGRWQQVLIRTGGTEEAAEESGAETTAPEENSEEQLLTIQ